MKVRNLFAATALLLGAAAGARADATIVWRGIVDDTVRLVVRGNQVYTETVRGRDASAVGVRSSGDRIEPGDTLSLEVSRGRGEARVVEFPSSRNRFTTVIELRDRDNGAAPYELRLVFRDDRRGGNGRWDRNDDRNGRWDDRRDDRDQRENRWPGNGRPGGFPGGGKWDDRRDDRRDDRPDARETLAAYRLGFELGQRDCASNARCDWSRHRARCASNLTDDFRRGYEAGFSDTRPRRGG